MLNYDSVVDEKRVLCGSCALGRVGLVMSNCIHLDLMTDYKDFDKFNLVYLTYYYYPNIDYTHWVHPSSDNKNILVPTKERALVEYIKNEKWCDEGILIEALKNYLEFFRNDEELFKVADFFELDRDILHYWINEALEDKVD